MSQAFDKYEKLGAYHWDWYDNPDYAWYKVCVDRCVKFCKGRTLDLGCGDGLVMQKIKDNGFKVHGFENDNTAIRIVYDNDMRASWVDLDDLENYGIWQSEPFDYMVCLNTIEHLKTPEMIIKIFKQCVMKAGIIITDKATEHKGRYHEHEYTKEELLDTFKEFNPKYFVINSTEFGKPIQFHGVEIKK